MTLSWKTIDTIKVYMHDPASFGHPSRVANTNDEVEFQLRYGRRVFDGGQRLDDGGVSEEKFRIENKPLGLEFEGDSIQDVRDHLRAFLDTTQDLRGTWELWVEVNTSGGYDVSTGRRGESGSALIGVSYWAIFTTPTGEKRHLSYEGDVPDPFTGEWKQPASYKDLRWLRKGLPDAFSDETYYGGRKKTDDEMKAVMLATPEIVQTLRFMMRRLGGFGEEVRKSLLPRNIQKTIGLIQSGQVSLLESGFTREKP